MIEDKTLSIIQKFTSSVFENSINEVEAEKSLNEIHAHFQKITEITGYDQTIENLAAVPAATGMALGLNHAAQCLLDYKRTVKFTRAIISVIVEKQKQQPGELVNVFYAGCGPYATLMTLIAPHFKSTEVQFTLLEINKNSVESAKKLIDNLNLSDYIKDIYIADAVTFKVPNADSFDIVISETLDALLYRECYVPILFNLLPQFNKNIILIPENVIINLSFVPPSKDNTGSEEYEVGSVFNVRQSLASYPSTDSIPLHFPDETIDLTPLNMSTYEKFILDTKVHVQGDIWLNRNESSLTIPLIAMLNQPFQDSSVVFTYYMDPETQLNCRFE